MLYGCKTSEDYVNAELLDRSILKKYQSFGFMKPMREQTVDFEQVILESIIFKRFESMGYTYADQSPDIVIGIRYFAKPPQNNTPGIDEGLLVVAMANREGVEVFRAVCKDYRPGQSLLNTASSVGRMMDHYEVARFETRKGLLEFN